MNGHVEGFKTDCNVSDMTITKIQNKAPSANGKGVRVYHYVCIAGLGVHKCRECGKVFECFTHAYRYKRRPKGLKRMAYYCSYTCYRKEEINAKQFE